MRRFLIICFVWLGFVGMAEAGGRPVFDYIPEVWGMDFSTAKKPHVEVPGGEWHMISGDGTIYPDIINYCDPDESPECMGHMYVACWAWTIYETNEIGKQRRSPICEDIGIDGPGDGTFRPVCTSSDDIRPSVLYYYKLDVWNPDGMAYHYAPDGGYIPVDEIPFQENKDPDDWLGERVIDIYFGQCRPEYSCIEDKMKEGLSLAEAAKSCPLHYCSEYGFEKNEDVKYFNKRGMFIYPNASIAFPFEKRKDGSKYIHINYVDKFYDVLRHGTPTAPARWLPGQPEVSLWVDDEIAKVERYDGSQDAEDWFFDNILDEYGNLFLKNDVIYHALNFDDALDVINKNRFGCIKASFESYFTTKPSYLLHHHLAGLKFSSPSRFYFLENRYLNFTACTFPCHAFSRYFIDTADKNIAVVTTHPSDFFSDDGPLKDDYYLTIFISHKGNDDFIQKSLQFEKNIKYFSKTIRPTIFVRDCRG